MSLCKPEAGRHFFNLITSVIRTQLTANVLLSVIRNSPGLLTTSDHLCPKVLTGAVSYVGVGNKEQAVMRTPQATRRMIQSTGACWLSLGDRPLASWAWSRSPRAGAKETPRSPGLTSFAEVTFLATRYLSGIWESRNWPSLRT